MRFSTPSSTCGCVIAMSKWNMVHEEYLGSADRTLTIWSAPLDRVMFEVNEQGLRHKYYQTAKEALEGNFPIADACYGYTMLMWEDHETDRWFDLIWDNQDNEQIISCAHKGTCEEEFHRAQVVLGNAEE